ncbi:alpha/beta hydrolase [Gracilibacillus salinarum]|uniref:Alpha/beta fold hydrolase n=1 Tax=Gracilibacillus salinarum TaxID=2932255 RepID=A0ABY4GJB7_9BACI|nr:alpha/beta fold hydrolase [Gracilibacillus salinarum]UOQ84270.1 alpha/beta fold hydrolase [Gracilibacillus salinarum]
MPACLILHGFTGGPYEVEPLAVHIAEQTGWEVVTPSLPGHGLGQGRDLDLMHVTYQEWIEEAENAYVQLRESHQEIFLIGFSMGGMIAAYLAAKYACEKLVLLSTSRKYINVSQMGLDFVQFAQKAIRKTLKQDPLYNHYRSKSGSVPLKAISEFLKCMKFTKPYLKKINCPVFIAQGIQDGMVPYKAVQYLDKEIPSESEIMYFCDSKHLICLGEDKKIVIDTVCQFLKNEQKTRLTINA